MEKAVYERMASLERQHWWFRGRRAILAALLATLPLPARARVLEVGSGTGGNLALLGALGEVVALEPDATARALCRRHRGVTPVAGALPDAVPLEAGSFDLVAAFDVIEHLEADRRSLETLRGLLRPGGQLVMTVPAFPALWSAHDRSHHHRRRYRRRPLARLLREAGFEVQYLSYYNCLLLPLVAAVRALKRCLPGEAAPDDRMPSPWVNGLLYRLFAWERHWVARRRRLPVGVSLIAVATRPGDAS